MANRFLLLALPLCLLLASLAADYGPPWP